MGTRIIKMDAAQGFSAQGAGAAVILASSHYGFPLSTTQVISGGVMGVGAGKKLSAVRWGVAGNIVVAWLLTLPAAAAMGAAVYGFSSLFGNGAAGPVIITVLGIAADRARIRSEAAAGTVARVGVSMPATIVETKELLDTVLASFDRGHWGHHRLRDPDLRSGALHRNGEKRQTGGGCRCRRARYRGARSSWPLRSSSGLL